MPTGQRLYAEVLQPVGAREGIESRLFLVRSRTEFRAAIAETTSLARTGGGPIVHLEMHGDTDGLQLASGEIMAWPELIAPLQELNVLMRMNLLVVAAACRGWHMSDILRPTARSPAWAIIGPPENVRAGNVLEASSTFYSSLFSGQDFDSCVRAMNASDDIANWTYRFQVADLLFCMIFKEYVKLFETEESRDERIARLVVEFARSRTMDVIETAKFRLAALETLNDDRFWYDRYKESFLLLDLFPENRSRFRLDFADCNGSDKPIS